MGYSGGMGVILGTSQGILGQWGFILGQDGVYWLNGHHTGARLAQWGVIVVP